MTEQKNDSIKTHPQAGVAASPGGRHGMNEKKRFLLGLAFAVAALCLPRTAVAAPGGTDILHSSFSAGMVNTGIDADARGKVAFSHNRQGNADTTRLNISLTRLNPNTAYQLIAFVGDDTNATSLAVFTTDPRGAFRVSYVKKAQGKISSRQKPLPDALDPMCNVRELSVVNGNSETVLRAVLTGSANWRYLIVRSMINPGFLPGAAGKLIIHVNPHSAQFRLSASGLTTNTDYRLSINGNLAQPSTADKAGRLNLKHLPPGSPDALDIQTVALTDGSGGNVVLISGGLGLPCSTAAQAPLALGTNAKFVVLAGSTVANTGPTTVTGDLGLSPGSAVTGFPPGTVVGTQHVSDTAADQAQLDLTTAYNAAAGRTVGAVSVAGNLGGQTLAPGLYKSTDSLEISSGDLTLDAKGDVNGVFIFQIASTLTTTAGRQVILSGGAKAANVYWQVGSSATLGTTTIFKGTIMADQSITLTTGATLDGRALARIGAVTLDSNTITTPAP